MPASYGLYDPRHEHDACGLGALVQLDGTTSHRLVAQAVEVLRNLDHRGATGSDPETGDGAGILTQLPDAFLRRACAEVGIDLPPPGDYGVGMTFLPQDPLVRLRCEELCARIIAEEGHRALGWRDVPVRMEAIGELARASAPVIRQLLVERREGDPEAFERKLYVIRRRVEKAAQHLGVEEAAFTFTSLSSRTLVYKGLLRARQLDAFYPDLAEPDFAAAIALVHSRFSTNTLGTWDLAHPFNFLAHNGEINTVRGNANWLRAREPQLRSELFGGDLQKLFPIADERWSDSATLDAMLELLVRGGRSLAHAVAMLIPPAWSDPTLDLPDEVRAFYEYHSTVVEPWDGPAAVIATDGTHVAATLDRNGLRPARWLRTVDGLVVLASEIGVLDLDPATIVESNRLAPGRMLLLDTNAGRVVPDDEIKRVLARRQPYRRWLDEHKLYLDDLRPQQVAPLPPDELVRLQQAFGYTTEELRLLIGPMARDGYEPVGSMGDDAPLAALSERPKLLGSYFKQQFAQVTNPPIDPQREELVMSLRVGVGAIGNLLGERPEDCRRVTMLQPVLPNGELEKLRHLRREGFRAQTLSTLYPVREGAAGLERALDELCRRASQAVWSGTTILILSDRGVDDELAPIGPLLATAAVHSHLVREGARTMCGLVVESGEPRETMHVALLLGYGASAVNPYLALETLRCAARSRRARRATLGEARQRYVKAIGKGLLKVCSKMGISTIQSYRGAQIFEAVGLGRRLVDRYFTGTISRVGGLELPDIADEVAERHERGFPPVRAGGTPRSSTRRRVPAAPARRAPRLEPGLDRAPAAGRARRRPRVVRGLRRGDRRAERAAHDAARPARARVRRRAGAARGGRVVGRHRQRFATGAMSLGSISPEAHETLAIAMNRLGARSNTGEGGEDPARSVPDPTAACGARRSSRWRRRASA